MKMFIDEQGAETDPMVLDGVRLKTRKPWARTKYITINDEDSLTSQADGDNTDVNEIVARFARTGQMPNVNEANAQYGDVSALNQDLTELINNSRQTITTTEEFCENWTPAPEETNPEPPDPAPTPQAAA